MGKVPENTASHYLDGFHIILSISEGHYSEFKGLSSQWISRDFYILMQEFNTSES